MFKKLKIAATTLAAIGMVGLWAGCACKNYSRASTVSMRTTDSCSDDSTEVKTTSTRFTSAAPPNAQVGECYATVFIPAQFESRTERVCVKPASERMEVIPAEYEWVDEKVCVKDASKQLIEEPAEYRTTTETLVMEPGGVQWVKENSAHCRTVNEAATVQPQAVFCLVSQPATETTITSEKLVKAASVREVTIPAEFQMVRKQKLVKPASTRCVTVPAEFKEVSKSVKVADARFEWQKVTCEGNLTAEKKNEVKRALLATGHEPGPMNGEFEQADYVAIENFQQENRLASGALTHETLINLGVEVP